MNLLQFSRSTWELMKNTENRLRFMGELVLESKHKIAMPLFGTAYAVPNKGTTNL